MFKTILVLPNGTQISSGAEEQIAVRSFKLTAKVNDSKELNLGSVCSNLLEIELQTPSGGLELTAGEEIMAYRQDETGFPHLLGRFLLAKLERASANTMRITAYDRVSLLDKDLTQWLENLTAWPYTLSDFAQMVCTACGLELESDSIPNGDYPVRAFAAQGITGRTLMQWVAEAAGRFCRATPQGKLQLAWYEPSGVTLTESGARFFYQDGLRFEDYTVAPVEKVQLKQSQDDVGVIWPNETGDKNTYVISGNYLLTTESTEALLPVAQTLFEQLKDVTYTPCKVQIPACLDIWPGHILQITDRNGKTFTTYVMTKTQSGQRDTLECTGSYRRDTTTAVNSEAYRALKRRMLEVIKKVEGLNVRASQLQEQTDNTQTEMHSLLMSVGELYANADSIRASVSNLEKIVDSAADEVISTKEQIASVDLQANQLEVKIEKLTKDGVTKVSNTTGTFNEDGLEINSTDSPTKTQITPDGMSVYKKSYGSDADAVLTAKSDGVDAVNLHAKTYLIVGGRSRFENYGSNRTGCFWIGG